MSKINTIKTGWNDAAREIDALVSMAKSQGAAEGKGGMALPNIALAFAKAASEGKVADVKAEATRIYVAYGEARNKSGAGKTINTSSDDIMKTPVSKLSAFANLAMDKTLIVDEQGNKTNRTVGEVFFETFAGDVELWRGSHYENLYKAVSTQLRRIEAGYAEVLSRETIEVAVLKLAMPVSDTEETSLANILKLLDLHINGKQDKKGKTNPRLPGFGDPTGDLDKAVKLLSALKAKAHKSLKRDFNKVTRNPDAFANGESDDEGASEGEERSFIGAAQ